MAKNVRVGKIDLDTAGAALLLGITREDAVVAIRGNAASEDLADPKVICIEVGGSGEVHQNNWDHHAAAGPQQSATWQVYSAFYVKRLYSGNPWPPSIARLVDYINMLDTMGAEALRRQTGGNVAFPTLSDVFAGMLLTERNPVEQLHKGVELLKKVLATGQNPFRAISGFNSYAKAKEENNRQIALAVQEAQWDTTRSGRRLALLETEFFGAPGALYGAGAEIVVVFNPRFGDPPVPKFTIAGNDIKVDAALPALLEREKGWGGPPTGTIIGSPREGSSLTFKEVIEIVKNAC